MNNKNSSKLVVHYNYSGSSNSNSQLLNSPIRNAIQALTQAGKLSVLPNRTFDTSASSFSPTSNTFKLASPSALASTKNNTPTQQQPKTPDNSILSENNAATSLQPATPSPSRIQKSPRKERVSPNERIDQSFKEVEERVSKFYQKVIQECKVREESYVQKIAELENQLKVERVERERLKESMEQKLSYSKEQLLKLLNEFEESVKQNQQETVLREQMKQLMEEMEILRRENEQLKSDKQSLEADLVIVEEEYEKLYREHEGCIQFAESITTVLDFNNNNNISTTTEEEEEEELPSVSAASTPVPLVKVAPSRSPSPPPSQHTAPPPPSSLTSEPSQEEELVPQEPEDTVHAPAPEPVIEQPPEENPVEKAPAPTPVPAPEPVKPVPPQQDDNVKLVKDAPIHHFPIDAFIDGIPVTIYDKRNDMLLLNLSKESHSLLIEIDANTGQILKGRSGYFCQENNVLQLEMGNTKYIFKQSSFDAIDSSSIGMPLMMDHIQMNLVRKISSTCLAVKYHSHYLLLDNHGYMYSSNQKLQLLNSTPIKRIQQLCFSPQPPNSIITPSSSISISSSFLSSSSSSSQRSILRNSNIIVF